VFLKSDCKEVEALDGRSARNVIAQDRCTVRWRPVASRFVASSFGPMEARNLFDDKMQSNLESEWDQPHGWLSSESLGQPGVVRQNGSSTRFTAGWVLSQPKRNGC
jgi:hypothetical protein